MQNTVHDSLFYACSYVQCSRDEGKAKKHIKLLFRFATIYLPFFHSCASSSEKTFNFLEI